MAHVSNAIAEFWRLFRRRSVNLAATTSADSPVYDALLKALHVVSPGLYLEFSSEPGACELIVTAEGDRALFPLALAVVADAPTIRGWTIRALKPKLGFPTTLRWQGFTLRTADVLFLPLDREGSNELGLRFFIPGVAKNETEDAHNAVLRAIDHGLGEEAFAESVQYTEVHPFPAHAAAGNLIPLIELPAFIESRASKRRGGAG
jgi:hypothetical protein